MLRKRESLDLPAGIVTASEGAPAGTTRVSDRTLRALYRLPHSAGRRRHVDAVDA